MTWAGRIGDIEVADSSPFGGPVNPLMNQPGLIWGLTLVISQLSVITS